MIRVADRVRLVAPAGPLPPDQLTAGVAALAGWGLRVSLGAHVRDRHPSLPYLAGTDTDRARDLRAAWCDPDVAAVFCARGGYGCLRLLDLLDWPSITRRVPLIGPAATGGVDPAVGGRQPPAPTGQAGPRPRPGSTNAASAGARVKNRTTPPGRSPGTAAGPSSSSSVNRSDHPATSRQSPKIPWSEACSAISARFFPSTTATPTNHNGDRRQ